jgi:hypothetical protein
MGIPSPNSVELPAGCDKHRDLIEPRGALASDS